MTAAPTPFPHNRRPDAEPAGVSAPNATGRALDVVRDLARQWILIAIAAFVAALAVGTREWLRPRTYTSIGTFVLQGGRSAPAFAGLASQFGISLPAADPGQSPGLYVEILRSRTVLAAVAHGDYCEPCAPGAQRATLVRLLGIAAPDTGLVTAEAIGRLSQMVSGSINPKNGIITIAATAQSASLAQQIGQRALAEVTRFNLQSRQTQAGAERRFTEGRLDDVAGDLRAAEQRLKAFRESNRFTGLSPELQLRESQLDREVLRYNEVYTALARTLEQSKIDELRDTPTIMVVDPPGLPYTPNGRGLVLKSLFGGIVGGTLAALILAWRASRRRRA